MSCSAMDAMVVNDMILGMTSINTIASVSRGACMRA